MTSVREDRSELYDFEPCTRSLKQALDLIDEEHRRRQELGRKEVPK
jgi:hypothetical protein